MPDLTRAPTVAATLAALTALTSLAVHLLSADEARELLGFTFEGLPKRPGESVDVFTNNVRVLGAVLVACGIVQIARHSAIVAVCDVALLVGCAVHVLLVGAALGAYGSQTLKTVLAHAPFELGAFSLVLALYAAVRRERVSAWRLVGTALAATAALAVGAVLEVFA
jgi:hypothetical protein